MSFHLVYVHNCCHYQDLVLVLLKEILTFNELDLKYSKFHRSNEGCYKPWE